jgi:potassium efflux system protein
MKVFYLNKPIAFFLFAVLLFLLPVSAKTGLAEEKTPPTASQAFTLKNLADTLEKSRLAETGQVEILSRELEKALALEKTLTPEINSLRIQTTTFNNVLLLPETSQQELYRLRTATLAALTTLAERSKDLAAKRDAVAQIRSQTQQQIELNDNQLKQLQTQPPKDVDTKHLKAQLQQIAALFIQKRNILEKTEAIYTRLIQDIDGLQQAYKELSTRADQQAEAKKKQALFERQSGLSFLSGWMQIQKEIGQLAKHAARLLSPTFWAKQFDRLWQTSGVMFVAFLVLLGLVQLLVRRLRRMCKHLLQKAAYQSFPWRCMAMRMLEKSLPLLASVVFVLVYAQTRQLYDRVPLMRPVIHILLIGLFSRWVLDFLRFINTESLTTSTRKLLTLLAKGVAGIRLFATLYVVFDWLLRSTGVLLLFGRLALEICLLVFCIRIWKRLNQAWSQRFGAAASKLETARLLVINLGYGIVGGGLLVELFGYGQLAIYWYTSWSRSIVVGIWGFVLIAVLQEWDKQVRARYPGASNGAVKSVHLFSWLIIRLLRLAWGFALVLALMLAWDAKESVIIGLFQALNYPLPIGSLRFSLLGLFYGAVVMLLTHVGTRLVQRLLSHKILAESGLDPGLQGSITAITTYVLWALGILGALFVIGVNATSIAVVFGALGIGLGFGLQNIFNNFISGIILLFERPIQVGDAVEIAGVWGVVKKINVRSTLVQTYDNASLIIPNSEFISNHVVNWSFKDMSLRRSITVGVAYGSDLERVRATLLEIGETIPDVLSEPKPQVLFTDFGDSALIFKLRIWTDLDSMLAVETAIRFEIDRRFRQLGIEIAFPQRDIHIRTDGKTPVAETLT